MGGAKTAARDLTDAVSAIAAGGISPHPLTLSGTCETDMNAR
jgi:hypothetical protein